ncbi:MAG: serine kinase [Bacteroidales bacterium]|jgi:predicted transcriptional regulator|nr:serine kinase [Bacteroidales bacterium]
MKLSEIIEKLNLQVIVNYTKDIEVNDAYVSDLLSDVMGNSKAGQIWITMQTHKNVAGIASLKDLAAIIIISNGKPEEDVINFAKDEEVCILSTTDACFEVAGKLYKLIK